MEAEKLFSKSKWSILKELAKGGKSASEIAKKTSQSTANVTIQLKILEGQDVVKKSKSSEPTSGKQKVGKPKIPYELSQELAVLGVLRHGLAGIHMVKYNELDDFQKYLINAGMLLSSEAQYALIHHFFETNLLKKAETIALVSEHDNEIELFVIMESGLADYREKYSNHTIETFGKTKKVISWSHHMNEVVDGMSKGEEYFLNLVRGSKELLDKNGTFAELKEK